MPSLKHTPLAITLSVLMLAGCQSMNHESASEHQVPSPILAEPMSAGAPAPALAAYRDMAMLKTARLVETVPVQNTERYGEHVPNPVQSVAQSPISTFGVDVDTGSYANTRRLLNDGRLPQAGAVRTEEFINYFDYDYLKPTEQPFSVQHTLIESPYKSGAKLLKIAIAAKETTKDALPPANLVFLVDVSGSMKDKDKLPLAKQTLRILTEQLRDTDSVSIITYANGEKLILPATYATKEGKAKMLNAINQMQADGATAGEQAIQLAYAEAQKHHKKDGINRILLMTDGDFNVGITDFNALKDMVSQKRKSGISLSTFGYGTGNYNEHLMEQLADAGDGNYSYIDSDKEAKKVLSRQLSSTLATVAQDVKVQVEFNPATVKEYRLIGYENRVLNEEGFKNDNVDSGDIGAGHQVSALYEIIPVGTDGYLADKRYTDTPKQVGQAGQAGQAGLSSEYAKIAVRYKLPNQSSSQEISQIVPKKSATRLSTADTDTRFLVAVASFAEMLKGGQYTGNLTWQDIKTLAVSSQGKDTYGLRAEFVTLVDVAQSLSSSKSAE